MADLTAGSDSRAAIREYLEGRGYAHHDATHPEVWELSGPGAQPSLRVFFWPRTTRVYAGIDWRDEFDVDRPPGPIVAYLEATERELGLAPAQDLVGRSPVLSGVLRSQVNAAITAHEDDDEWPVGAVDAVMAVIGAALETHETAGGTALGTVREQARRYLRAVHGPDLVYRAPESFTGPDRWAWAVANDQAPMAETAIAGIEQACAQRSEGSSRG